MKTKQLLILGGVLVVLAIVVLVFENPFGKSEYEKKVETATPLFPNFDKEQVAKNRNHRHRWNNNALKTRGDMDSRLDGQLSRG